MSFVFGDVPTFAIKFLNQAHGDMQMKAKDFYPTKFLIKAETYLVMSVLFDYCI